MRSQETKCRRSACVNVKLTNEEHTYLMVAVVMLKIN